MAMNIVQIISREIIKPSTPTPTQPNTYKLSLLDQLSPPMYAPIVLFYSPTAEVSSGQKVNDHLKSSLSKTLTHFYPFAGRFSDAFSVDCNNHGVSYIEANVATDMPSVLNQPEVDFLSQLLPCNPHERSADLLDQLILAVKVSFFSCGGIAIGVCIWHALANASAMASFVTSWAAIARGANSENDMDGVVINCTSLFPPQDLLAFSTASYLDKDSTSRVVTKRFVFDGSKIASLREKIGNRSTRVEALSALIWGAVIAIAQEKERSWKPHLAVSIVDLRKRMNPPLPEKCVGNINQLTVALWPTNMEIDYSGLAENLRQSIRIINDEYVRKVHEDGEYLKFIKSAGGEAGKMMAGVISFSSWCKFPFYEADFGWGKPAWIGTAMGLNNLVIFIDAKDGEGIEAWVSLPEEDMLKFQQNSKILEHASIIPTA